MPVFLDFLTSRFQRTKSPSPVALGKRRAVEPDLPLTPLTSRSNPPLRGTTHFYPSPSSSKETTPSPTPPLKSVLDPIARMSPLFSGVSPFHLPLRPPTPPLPADFQDPSSSSAVDRLRERRERFGY
ncbi:hypothetical protein JCM8097_000425 [Rhodosporidiobolus ruineniae]